MHGRHAILAKRYRILSATLLAIASSVLVPPEHAQEIDWKTGRLGHLAAYIGTYRYDKVLDDPAVRAALVSLGGTETDVIVENLTVAAPIDFISGQLVLRGNAPHRGGLEEAIVLVRIFDGTVRAALLHQGHMSLYARDAEYAYLPPVLQTFLQARPTEIKPATLPPGVLWEGRSSRRLRPE